MEEHKALKRKIYRQYQEAFEDIPEIVMNPLNPDGDDNCWLSCMTIAEGTITPQGEKITPDMIMDALEKENAESRPIWKPLHLQPVFAQYELITAKAGSASVAEDIFDRGLCLPSDIKNTPEDMELIIKAVRGCFGRQ